MTIYTHSYFASRPEGNLLIDSPRYAAELVEWFDGAGGIAHILLSHSDDVADADQYARRFGARVWIHREDASAAPYATDLLDDGSATNIAINVRAIPVPGHTRGSVVYLLDDRVMFSGDSLAWSPLKKDLVAFRDACWYSWTELTDSLSRLAMYRFEWLVASRSQLVRAIAGRANEFALARIGCAHATRLKWPLPQLIL
ncbi:glyoxylase-like metal-dependent hydrolase (beta-lactamase superfamily II) [Paraburkholderia sp. MM5477-R1]